MKNKFSYYKGPIRNVKPFRSITLADAADIIRSDEFKEDIERLRTATNEATQKTIKGSLSYFTFSGVFTKRLNDGLKSHSGYICIDIDDLPAERLTELRQQLIDSDIATLIFTSPSGNGLKVIFRIDPAHHDETFTDIASFIDDNFNVTVDQSGKDVARACFVSYDPDVHFNPDAPIFKHTTPSPAPQSKKTTQKKASKARSQFQINQDLRRVEHVVSQIIREQIDITEDDYDNRLTVGFALATLGEEARELYKSVVQYNNNDEDPDKKFDDALQNGKFKTPNKFFSLARAAGLNTKLPRTIQDAQKQAEIEDIIGDKEYTDTHMAYGLWYDRDRDIYRGLDLKNRPIDLSNFSMRVLFHVNTSADEAYRLIQIKNIWGLDKVIQINTDDFVSAGSFKKVLARQGNFLWFGQDYHLVKLQDMLQRNEKATQHVKHLGYNRRGNFWAWANGIIKLDTNQFLPIDEFGIIESTHEGKSVNYFIPALSRIFVEKEDLFSNDKKFKLQRSPVTFEEWATLFCKVFKDNGKIGIAYWIAAVFSDIIFKSLGDRMPILFAYGQRGSGKGTMIQSILRLFGEKQDQIMLGGASTIVGFMRKLAQFSNALTWLDEYKNTLNPKIVESLKNIYDRIGYERGRRDNTFQTESTPILSAVVLSGQEMPTVEPALFTRCMLISFTETKRTEEARELYRRLVRIEDAGISQFTAQLLTLRKTFQNTFQNSFEEDLRTFISEINNKDVDERMLQSYTMLITCVKLVSQFFKLPFTVSAFSQLCKELILEQYTILKGSDDTSKFWQIIEQLFSTGEIMEDRQFQLRDGFIDIRIQDVYQLYAEAMHRRRDPNLLAKPTLDNYLMSDPKTFVCRHKVSFGGKYTWALRFNYRELGIDLIRFEHESERLAKYKEMGVEYEEQTQQHNATQEALF